MPPATRRRSIWLPSLGGLISEVVEGQNLATHFTTISLALAKMRNPSLGKLGGLERPGLRSPDDIAQAKCIQVTAGRTLGQGFRLPLMPELISIGINDAATPRQIAKTRRRFTFTQRLTAGTLAASPAVDGVFRTSSRVAQRRQDGACGLDHAAQRRHLSRYDRTASEQNCHFS